MGWVQEGAPKMQSSMSAGSSLACWSAAVVAMTPRSACVRDKAQLCYMGLLDAPCKLLASESSER